MKNKNNNKRFKDAKIYFRVEHKHSTSTTERKRREAVWWVVCQEWEKPNQAYNIQNTCIYWNIFTWLRCFYGNLFYLGLFFYSWCIWKKKMTIFLLLLLCWYIVWMNFLMMFFLIEGYTLLAVCENSFTIIIMLNLLYVFYANGILYADEKD